MLASVGQGLAFTPGFCQGGAYGWLRKDPSLGFFSRIYFQECASVTPDQTGELCVFLALILSPFLALILSLVLAWILSLVLALIISLGLALILSLDQSSSCWRF